MALVGCGGGSEEDCDEIAKQIEERAAQDPEVDAPCGPRDAPERDHPDYQEACNDLRECLGDE